ncbi:fatty acid oxygenase PpoA [Pseudohyphozyma bogoriensis]|nr:fatty acid oxygenase PpoA [Pseudohyphozyma bogoriensis]
MAMWNRSRKSSQNTKPFASGAGGETPSSHSRGESILDFAKDTISTTASSVVNLIEASRAGVPAAPDGLTAKESAPASAPTPTTSLLHSIFEQVKDKTLFQDTATLLQAAHEGTAPLDDRKLLLEHVVHMLATLPEDSPIGPALTNSLIKLLWEDLPHPPAGYVSGAPYKPAGNRNEKGDVSDEPIAGASPYRAADGSGNNPTNPSLGAAGTPYARSVPPLNPLPHSLPDPGVVFDALLKRRVFTPHPSGISSLLFNFATTIIHSIFQTNRFDPKINDASSYLDLSVLYGNNQKEQDQVRTFKQGMLYPDCVAAKRLFVLPPATIALVVLFSRNHNYIAQKLYEINEKGTFKPADQLDEAAQRAQDQEIFQTARLINCGYFINIVFCDYIRVILNTNRTESTWNIIPVDEIKNMILGTVPVGVGNSVSVEFNILYRWHTTISEQDDEWLSGVFRRYLGNDKPFEEITPQDFLVVVQKLEKENGDDPRKFHMIDYKRQENGYFKDEDLTQILTNATTNIAGEFKAQGSPVCMRVIEVLGITAARSTWGVCSINEFRKFLNLQPFKDFEEWNPDPEIAGIARNLYTHIDNLELVPGLAAEQRKPSMPGSGLAPGYTISRAILSDAVALTRGDRYFTTEHNARNYTAWGYEDSTPDKQGGSFGGMIGKLMMRTLPGSYTFNSIYALFPFSTPETTRKILTDLKIEYKYDFSVPRGVKGWTPVKTMQGCIDILNDHRRFNTIYQPTIELLVQNPYGFFIAFDPKPQDKIDKHRRDREIMSNAVFYQGWEQDIKEFYSYNCARYLQSASWTYDGGKTRTVDVVRDVFPTTIVSWVAHNFGLPLKTEENKRGLFTPGELYLVLSAFFTFVFLNFDPVTGFKLREAAVTHSGLLGGIVGIRFAQILGTPPPVDNIARKIQDLLLGPDANAFVMGKHAREFYSRLLKSDRPLDQLSASAQSIMVASTANQAEVAAHVINFYLRPENKKHYDAIVAAANSTEANSDAILLAYIYEAMRLDPQVPGIPRLAGEDATIKDGNNQVKVRQGDMIFCSMWHGNRDPAVYPEPDEVNPNRPKSSYKLWGSGIHTCLGAGLVDVSMPAMIREVFKLKNVRRAPGNAGQLFRIHQELAETPVPVYIAPTGSFVPFPASLSIVWDA